MVQIRKDLDDLGLSMEPEDACRMTKMKFKNLVKKNLQIYTFSNLLERKTHHTKMKRIRYSNFQMQSYLNNEDISIEKMKNILLFRTGMAKFAENYGRKEKCILCKNHDDSQFLLKDCEALQENLPTFRR